MSRAPRFSGLRRATRFLIVGPLTTVAVAALLASPTPARAQLAHASASTLGLAGNHTALARGFGAISVNPAGLGMSDSGFGLAIGPARISLGAAPITMGDLADYQGVVVPDAVKAEWLARVTEEGGLRGSAGGDLSVFALAIGGLGLQLSTVASSDVNLPTGLVEALLFGNGGRTGEAVDLPFTGGSIESYLVSTAGVAYGFRVSPGLVLGVTGKLSRGHFLAVGRSDSGGFQSDPLGATVDFSLVTSCTDEAGCTENYANGGTGVGLDVGGILELGELTLAASLQDLVNTFSWNEERLGFRPGTAIIDRGDSETDFDEQAFSGAPSDIQAIVRDYGFDPAYRLGAALDVTSALTVTADIHGRFANDGMALGPKYHTGVGAELRAGFLHLRGGLSKVPDALQYAGGFSLVLGPVNLSTAAALEDGATRDAFVTQFVLSIGDR